MDASANMYVSHEVGVVMWQEARVRVSQQSPHGQVAWFKGKSLLANPNPHSIVHLFEALKPKAKVVLP